MREAVLQNDRVAAVPELIGRDRELGRLAELAAAAFREMSASGPLAVLLDDLHWSDEATLDVLRLLAEVAERSRILVLGAYRSDAIPRAHPIRQLRTDLRRAGRLRELAVEPLG